MVPYMAGIGCEAMAVYSRDMSPNDIAATITWPPQVESRLDRLTSRQPRVVPRV